MTQEEMQIIFEGGFQVVITCFMTGLGLGFICRVILMGLDR